MPVALIALLGACGGDDDADGADTTPASAASTTAGSEAPTSSTADAPTTSGADAPTTSGETTSAAPALEGEVKIMVIAPDTNTLTIGAYPEEIVGARAAAKLINESGGINGAEVVVDLCDTKGDANEAVNCAQKAVDAGDYVAVVGGADNAGNYAETLSTGGIPNVAPFASAALLVDPNSYPLYSGQIGYFFAGMTSLLPENPTSLAVVYIDAGPLGAQLQALAGGFTAVHPEVKVNFVPISQNQGDYSPIVQTAAESDVIFLGMPSEPITRFLQTATQLGIDKAISVPSVTVQGESLEALGDAAEGLLSTAGFTAATSMDGEAERRFREAMDAIDPDVYKTDLAVNAYAGVFTVQAALEGVTNPTAADTKVGLDKLSGLDLGLLPPIQFTTPAQTFGPDVTRVFNDQLMNVKVEDGKLVPTSDFVNVLTGE